ncbi:hypothetical protein [Anaeromicropila herbilytica]|uniref:Lipoprotein n=1 Tax=Anaeromicropila herbilytica TaxID=2785025 RepID=A0A7R7EJ16_9FIRM|nr:hypothetical protein [Anaeromicropila herbilytica]BCN29596.1 hypothetical protein bsdtb5_08910 [Anaeromicropila herbilytica]
MRHNIVTPFILFCSICLLLTGCTIHNKAPSQRKYGFQPPMKELYWGMSLEEIEKTLNIKNGVDGVTYDYEKPITIVTLKNKIKEFGYNATVSLEICDKPSEDWFPYKSSYLTYVSLTYKNVDGNKIKDHINKLYGTGNDWVDIRKTTCTTWLSGDKIKDIKPDVKKKLKNYWDLLAKHLDYPKNGSISPVKKSNDAVNYITLRYSKEGAGVSFSGDTTVQINQITHK